MDESENLEPPDSMEGSGTPWADPYTLQKQ